MQEIEIEKDTIATIFYIYMEYLKVACLKEGKPLDNLNYHFNRVNKLRDKIINLLEG